MRIRGAPLFLGLFALITLVLAGAAVGKRLGAAEREGAYLALLAMVIVGWLFIRRKWSRP